MTHKQNLNYIKKLSKESLYFHILAILLLIAAIIIPFKDSVKISLVCIGMLCLFAGAIIELRSIKEMRRYKNKMIKEIAPLFFVATEGKNKKWNLEILITWNDLTNKIYKTYNQTIQDLTEDNDSNSGFNINGVSQKSLSKNDFDTLFLDTVRPLLAIPNDFDTAKMCQNTDDDKYRIIKIADFPNLEEINSHISRLEDFINAFPRAAAKDSGLEALEKMRNFMQKEAQEF